MGNNIEPNDADNEINPISIDLKEEEKTNKTFTSNSLVKKIRIVVTKEIKEFLNRKIKYYINNIGKGIFKKEFLDIDKSDLSHSNVEYGKKFIYFKLKDIFSKDITKKISRKPPDHNKKLVQKLISEETNGKNYFSEIFELTFLDCLEHIRGSKNNELLDGMKTMEEIFEPYKDDKNYYENLIENIKKYEINLKRKIPRSN